MLVVRVKGVSSKCHLDIWIILSKWSCSDYRASLSEIGHMYRAQWQVGRREIKWLSERRNNRLQCSTFTKTKRWSCWEDSGSLRLNVVIVRVFNSSLHPHILITFVVTWNMISTIRRPNTMYPVVFPSSFLCCLILPQRPRYSKTTHGEESCFNSNQFSNGLFVLILYLGKIEACAFKACFRM